MPNWVYCQLNVKGKRKRLDEFKEHMRGTDAKGEEALCNDKILPYPQKFRDLDKQMNDPNRSFNLKDPGDEQYKIDGLNGYDWCIKNWGTKWGICDSSLHTSKDVYTEFKEALNPDQRSELDYSFQTAWSMPLPMIIKMSEMYPDLKFKMYVEEESNEFKGRIWICNGKVVKDSIRGR